MRNLPKAARLTTRLARDASDDRRDQMRSGWPRTRRAIILSESATQRRRARRRSVSAAGEGLAAPVVGAPRDEPNLCRLPCALHLANRLPMTNPPDFSTADGLLPAIAQDADTGEVLMLAYMNAESFAETLATGRAVYYSRSRGRLWRKGEQSGHFQEVCGVFVDCDGDTILLRVRQIGGAACHEGYRSCFFRQVTPAGLQVVAQRVFDPATVYKHD